MDPPELPSVKEFMKNNEELPEAVMEDLQRGLAKPRQELASLEAEIQELRGRLTQLEIKQKQVEKYIDQYNCVLSPIRRVPTDILHNIFYHCLPTRRDPIMSAAEAPLLLTRICRAWRQTAHASPRLWARLYITFSDEDITDTHISYGLENRYISDMLRLRCNAVEEWLSRSGACPLSISLCYTSRIWANSDQSPGNSDNTLTLFRVLARYLTRWQRVELRMPIEVYRILEGIVPISQLPMLDSIRTSFFRQNDLGMDGSEDKPAITFLQVPNLKRISSSSYPASVNTILSNPNLMRLTSLSLNWMLPVSEAIFFLKNCPSLEYAMLTLMPDFPLVHSQVFTAPRTTHGIISLPHLRALYIVDTIHSDPVGSIYECIDAPQLEWVDYTKEVGYIDRNQTYPDQTAISALLRRSTNLKKLTIEANGLSTSDMRIILKSAQSVTHLVFGPETRTNGNLMAPLSIPTSGSSIWNLCEIFLQDGEEGMGIESSLTLLPRLEILEVSQGPSTHVPDDILRDIILKRLDPIASNGVAPLRKVSVLFSRAMEIDIVEELFAHSENNGNIELRLEYSNRVDTQSLWHFVSSSYGMDQYERSWPYRDIEEEMMFSEPVHWLKVG